MSKQSLVPVLSSAIALAIAVACGSSDGGNGPAASRGGSAGAGGSTGTGGSINAGGSANQSGGANTTAGESGSIGNRGGSSGGNSSSQGGTDTVAGAGNGGSGIGGSSAGNGSGQGGKSGTGGRASQAGAGGDDTRGGGGSTGNGGATSSGSGGDSGGSGGQGGEDSTPCGTIADSAPLVSETQRNGEMPAPRGGALEDGTYYLANWDVYPPASAGAEMHSTALRLSAGAFELVRDDGERQSGTFMTTGVVLTLTATCPPMPALSRPYTATATSLSLFTVSDNRVETLIRQ